MELNQENRSFCTPSAVLDTVAEQLADVDLTLPDYCPDTRLLSGYRKNSEMYPHTQNSEQNPFGRSAPD